MTSDNILKGYNELFIVMIGVSLPTVEEMIVNMKMATPTEGLITLSNTANPRLFSMAKVGLGKILESNFKMT